MPSMTPQGLTTTLWAYATLATLRGAELPACYAAAWNAVREMDARRFDFRSLCALFQVHLMHRFASDGSPMRSFFNNASSLSSSSSSADHHPPAFLMTEARDAWMRSVRDEVKVSTSQRMLAQVFVELGVKHEVERVTDDGYFSMDIYLPDYDACVEFDGPHHYLARRSSSSSSSSSSSPPSSSSRDSSGSGSGRGLHSRTRTAKTEVRDVLLAKQCAKVVKVPSFEFDACNTPEKRRRYVEDKLAKEAGIVI